MSNLGLYRRYDGKYAIVFGEAVNAENLVEMVEFAFIENPDKRFVWDAESFFSDLYKVIRFDENGEEKATYLRIADHPDNVTGQYVCFKKIKDLNKFEKNLSTTELVDELKKRKDNPFLDKEVNDKIYAEDFVLGVKHDEIEVGGRVFPAGVEVLSIFNSLESLEKDYIEKKVLGKDRARMFKRVFVEIDNNAE